MANKLTLIVWFAEVLKNNLKLLGKILMRFTIQQKWERYVKNDLKLKYGLQWVDLLEIAPDLDETIQSFSFLDGTSRVIDIALLKSIAKKFIPCTYLEIGSWRGESLLNIAEIAKEAVSISLSPEEMRALNFPEDVIAVEGIFLNNKTNITRIGHNSLRFDFSALDKKFDLIFVDGDHSYEAVKSDTKNVFSLLKNESSVIVWHDCGTNYEDMRYEVVAGILDGLPEEERRNVYRVSNTLCGVYTKKSHPVLSESGSSVPNKKFQVKIKSEKI